MAQLMVQLTKSQTFKQAPVAQWIEQDVSTVKAGGSNPSWGTYALR